MYVTLKGTRLYVFPLPQPSLSLSFSSLSNQIHVFYLFIQLQVGLFGLAVMGQNFALNMASKGFSVVVSNRSLDKVDLTVERAKAEGNLPLTGQR